MSFQSSVPVAAAPPPADIFDPHMVYLSTVESEIQATRQLLLVALSNTEEALRAVRRARQQHLQERPKTTADNYDPKQKEFRDWSELRGYPNDAVSGGLGNQDSSYEDLMKQAMPLLVETIRAGFEEMKSTNAASFQRIEARLARLEQQLHDQQAGNIPVTFEVTPQGTHVRQVPTYGNYGPAAIDQRLNSRQVQTRGPLGAENVTPAQSRPLEPFSGFPAVIPTPPSSLAPAPPPMLSNFPSAPTSSMPTPSVPLSQPQPQAQPNAKYMCNWDLSTVGDIWREWHEGIGAMPSISYLNQHHPTWRNGWHHNDIVKFSKRKQIIDAIERRAGGGIPVMAVVQEFTLAMQNQGKSIHKVWKAIVDGEKLGTPWP